MTDAGRYDAGMPRGTAQLALDLAARAAGAAATLTGRAYGVDRAAVLGHLVLPLVVGDAPAPTAPRPAPGGGWVHADVLPDDEELFAILAADCRGAEQLAGAAQECRLPVTPYRAAVADWSIEPREHPPGRRIEPGDVTVVDLTTMWAGPLATRLLAAWGARVVTIEPPMRPDGLRGSPAQFAALDAGKRRRPWDLRRSDDRRRFEDEVRRADVVVESFSPRVMPNLGYPPAELQRINSRLITVSLRAFPSTVAEASWVAYGRGVHAASGLVMAGGRPQPALLAYPDPLAGLLAFGAVLDALGAGSGGVVEVSLAGAMAPLLATSGDRLADVDGAAIAALRDATAGRPGGVIVAA